MARQLLLNPATVRVSVKAEGETLAACRTALELHQCPRSWRPSEYAMTKATASVALAAARDGAEQQYFDVSCLLGELARLYRWASRALDAGEAARALVAYLDLRGQCRSNPNVDLLERQAAEWHKEERRLNRAAKRLAKLRAEYAQMRAGWERRNGGPTEGVPAEDLKRGADGF